MAPACASLRNLDVLSMTVNAVLIFPKSAEVKFPTTAVAAISRVQ